MRVERYKRTSRQPCLKHVLIRTEGSSIPLNSAWDSIMIQCLRTTVDLVTGADHPEKMDVVIHVRMSEMRIRPTVGPLEIIMLSNNVRENSIPNGERTNC